MGRYRLPILAGLLALALATPATAEPPVWVIRDADSEIVLFGSVHILPGDVDWRPDALDAALSRADDLWFEAPMDDAGKARAQAAAQAQGYLPAGQTLSALLSPEGRARLARVCARLQVPVAAVDRMRPWFADLNLGLVALARQGALASSGVEQTLADAAPGATRKALESPETAIDMLATASMEEQVAGLEDTLRQLEEDPGFYDRLIRAWLTGDVDGLVELGLDPMRETTFGVYQSLILQRNRAWTETILERLEGSGETVIVVGAGHLVGPDSVPAMLRARGVAVTGP